MSKKINYLIFLFLTILLVIFIISHKNKDKKLEAKKVETVELINKNTTKTYNKIKTDSHLDWKASHLGGVNLRNGKIYLKEASILINNGTITNMNILIDMPSLTVDNLDKNSAYDLSEHLKHEDFFNTDKYPTSKFELTNLKAIQGKYNSEITGNLTILEISKSITFKAIITISDKEVSLKSEDFIINRKDWGMTYNAEGTAGVPLDYLISDDIGFNISIVCKQENENSKIKSSTTKNEVIHNISQLIDSIYTVDQNVQLAHNKAIQSADKKKVKELTLKQKATFKRHIPILKKIYNQIGYPTIEAVGTEHSNMYFTLVQHSDSDVKFQNDMLKVIKLEVKKVNVNAKNFAFLTDRVGLALNKKQVYGTQVNYNTEIGQAFPKPLIDSVNVNKRRKDIGLQPIEVYLNTCIKMHFQMNKAHYEKIGIIEPKLYKVN